jgi:hypothetical protein
MRALTKAGFKQWQTLPVLSRPLREGAETTRLPECRAAEAAGPSCAKPERVECRSRPTEAGLDAGNLPPAVSTVQVFQRP